MASVRDEWPAHAARIQSTLNAQPANDSGQMTVPIQTTACLACRHIELGMRRDTSELFNVPTKRRNSMSVNPTKKTPVAGSRGRGGRCRGGRGRRKELPILDHASMHYLVIPTNWCLGIIMPLYKNNGSVNDPDNYRGITLLSCLSKLFTSALNNRITILILLGRNKQVTPPWTMFLF